MMSISISRNIEIHDAILSLVHSYSQLDNKLERHEQRERSLGEIIKKAFVTLQKGQKTFEPMKGTFSRLEERVGQIESLLLSVQYYSSFKNFQNLILVFIFSKMKEFPSNRYGLLKLWKLYLGGCKRIQEHQIKTRNLTKMTVQMRKMRT